MCKNQELCWHFEVIIKVLTAIQIVQIHQKSRYSNRAVSNFNTVTKPLYYSNIAVMDTLK